MTKLTKILVLVGALSTLAGIGLLSILFHLFSAVWWVELSQNGPLVNAAGVILYCSLALSVLVFFLLVVGLISWFRQRKSLPIFPPFTLRQALAQDEAQEAEALEWAEGTLGELSA